MNAFIAIVVGPPLALAFLACTPSPADSVPQSSIDGRPFSITSGLARSIDNGNGVVIDVADFDLTCGSAINPAAGGRMLSLGVNSSAAAGAYEIDDAVLGGDVWATASVFAESGAPRSEVITEGTFRIDSFEDQVTGSADVGVSNNARFLGAFDVPRCAP